MRVGSRIVVVFPFQSRHFFFVPGVEEKLITKCLNHLLRFDFGRGEKDGFSFLYGGARYTLNRCLVMKKK